MNEVSAANTLPRMLLFLWRSIEKRRRIQLFFLIGFMTLGSFLEAFSIGIVIPFVGVLISPEKIFYKSEFQFLVDFLEISTPDELLYPLTIVFICATLVAGGMRMLIIWLNLKVSFATGADLSIKIYRHTLHQPYSVHVSRNSSEVINAITNKVNIVIYNVISPVITIFSSGIMLCVIVVALVLIKPGMALVALSGGALIYLTIARFSRKQLHKNSECIADNTTLLIKSLQEGLGGIRDILIEGNQETYCKFYRGADLQLRKAQANNGFISQCPRYLIESLGIVMIASLAFVMSKQPGGVGEAIPVIGALALGAQRLLPVLQQLFVSWSNLKGSQQSLLDAIALLNQPMPKKIDSPKELSFEKEIRCSEMSFSYEGCADSVLSSIEVSIPKGSRVGIVGTTGSGKSTFLDILMGLLEPSGGALLVDGEVLSNENIRSWQSNIAHVPQAIFLTDASIAENIALGVEKSNIDYKLLEKVVEMAQLTNTINSLERKYDTIVGERGARLSGGQRQRIGIARALYKNADVIIFDEATSALDDSTEKAIMQTIENMNSDLTIFIIAHRLTTLKMCDILIEIQEGSVKIIPSYNELTSRNSSVDYR